MLKLHEARQFCTVNEIPFPPDAVATWRQAINSAARGKVSALFNALEQLYGGEAAVATAQSELVLGADDAGDLFPRPLTHAEMRQVGFGGKRFQLQLQVAFSGTQTVTVTARPGMSFITVGQLLAWCALHEHPIWRFRFEGAQRATLQLH